MTHLVISLSPPQIIALTRIFNKATVSERASNRFGRLLACDTRFKSKAPAKITCDKDRVKKMANQLSSYVRQHDIEPLVLASKSWGLLFQSINRILEEDRRHWQQTVTDVGKRNEVVIDALLPPNGGSKFGGTATMFGGTAKNAS
jgi:hypothetical protein